MSDFIKIQNILNLEFDQRLRSEQKDGNRADTESVLQMIDQIRRNIDESAVVATLPQTPTERMFQTVKSNRS